jgi:hypothetical protein
MLRTALLAAASFGLIASAHAQHKVRTVTFELAANPAFVSCFSGGMPSATVTVRRGNLADRLLISVSGLRPNLQFDLFTVQRSSLDANGKPIPAANFPGFGLAWYQTDLEADDNGNAHAEIRTILLDQIFGFDADKLADGSTRVPPTNTFHVGFWFNNPDDAVPCGFDASKPTPFNGEHKAGPLAMISLPDPKTNLGPLCTDPTGSDPSDTSKLPCNP